MTTPVPYAPGPSCMQDATAKTYHAWGVPSTLNREPYFKGRKGKPKKRASYIKPSELFWSHSQALLWTGHKTKCLCSNVETSKSGGKPNVCKSPLQKQTSPHSCVNPHNPPGEQSFSTYMGLCSRFPSECSHCAQPPSNLEVNPPQTSTSMPCFLWLPACMFSTDFSSARCICPITHRVLQPLAPLAHNFSSKVQALEIGFKDEF